jgi:nanoRNase/pAp phosphatase (c-di-AMP/oligoRNAs hydrolase)
MVYALQPQINLSIHVLWGHERRNTVFAVGKSIFNTSSFVDIGTRMLARGGGGHPGAGTCQIPNDEAASVLAELIDELQDQPAARIAS